MRDCKTLGARLRGAFARFAPGAGAQSRLMSHSSRWLSRRRAMSRFCARLRVAWHVTRSPVGLCISSTLVDNLLIAWPPGPEPRMNRSARSASFSVTGIFLEPSRANVYLPAINQEGTVPAGTRCTESGIFVEAGGVGSLCVCGDVHLPVRSVMPHSHVQANLLFQPTLCVGSTIFHRFPLVPIQALSCFVLTRMLDAMRFIPRDIMRGLPRQLFGRPHHTHRKQRFKVKLWQWRTRKLRRKTLRGALHRQRRINQLQRRKWVRRRVSLSNCTQSTTRNQSRWKGRSTYIAGRIPQHGRHVCVSFAYR